MKKIIKAISVLLVAVMMCTSFPMSAFAASVHDMQNEVLDVANGEVGYTGTSKYCKYGEWYGYLRRDGLPTMPSTKGSTFKGPFHLPRCLMQLDQMMTELEARA